MNTQEELAHQAYILTKDQMLKWYFGFLTVSDYTRLSKKLGNVPISMMYLHEMGLPLESQIEGL